MSNKNKKNTNNYSNSNEQNFSVPKNIETDAAFLNLISDIIFRIDTKGKFVYVNNGVKNLGYEPEMLIGKHFSDIIHPDDIDKITRSNILDRYKNKKTGSKNSPKLFDERRTRNRATKDLVFRLIPKKHQGKTSRELELHNSIYGEVMSSGEYIPDVSSSKKKFIGSVGIIRNITDRIQHFEQKEKLNEQIFQSQKMEAIGQLAGGIAHDFNNLLGSISGYAELIRRKYSDKDPKLEKYSKSILSSAYRAATMTDKLLTFARKGNYQSVKANIHEIISDVLELTKCSIDDNILINLELNAEDPILNGEPNQIKNAVINIILNAKDAMPEGGKLFIRTRNKFLEKEFLRPLKGIILSGNYILLTIEDTGVGIDESIKPKIFEPFFTTKDIGEGTGLGLACVYGVMEYHRGLITVESKPGKGAKFYLYFPVSELYCT
ncbi:MAG: ATP-binding protein [Chitinispirillia bacterium]|jgi:signal transduction histidine kinase